MCKAETASSSAAQCQPKAWMASLQKAGGPAWQCVLRHFKGAHRVRAAQASSGAASCQAQLGAMSEKACIPAWQLIQVDSRKTCG